MSKSLEFIKARRQYGIRPGMERMYRMLDHFNHPEIDMPTIHIAGTNGKGSTLTYLKAAFIKNGCSVGTFSSPALETFNEQIMINGEAIREGDLELLIERIEPIIQLLDEEGDHPTEFEITVLIAILYFKEKVDIAIFEAGMGGREDSTNCVRPVLTIITNIEKDHTNFLGSTYEDIALHKAGIIKPTVPIITGNLHAEAQQVVKETAKEQHAPLFQLNHDFHSSQHTATSSITFSMGDWKTELLPLAMPGWHQVENAALALAAINLLQQKNWKIDLEVAKTAVQKAALPGRFEKMMEHPLLILDSAHNPAGLSSFIRTVETMYPEKKKHLLFAVFGDKDIESMIEQLDLFDTVIFTTFDHPRAASAEEIFHRSSHPGKQLKPDWKIAIGHLLTKKNEKDAIFVAGSLHFIGNVRKWADN